MKCFFFLLLLIPILSISQDRPNETDKKRDSLYAIWKDGSELDANRMIALDKLAWDVYLFSNPDSAFYYAEKYYNYAKSKGLKRNMASARTTQGASFYLRGDYKKATKYYLLALSLYENSIDNKGEKGYKPGISSVLNNLGMIHKEQGDLEKAIEYYSKSLVIKKASNNKRGLAITLDNIGDIYFSEGILDSAKIFLEKSIELYKTIKNTDGTYNNRNRLGFASATNKLGKVYKKEGQFKKALTLHHESLIIFEKINDKEGISSTEIAISSVYLALDNKQKAIKHAKIALEIAQLSGFVKQIESSSKSLYLAYSKKGDYKNALKMIQLNRLMSDSIKNQQSKEDIIKQEYQYKYDNRVIEDSIILAHSEAVSKAQLEAKNLKISNGKSLLLLLCLGISLLVISIGFIFYRYRVVTKQKSIIQKEKEMRENMMQEIHHRVKNNMQIIRSLLRLQSNKIDDTKIVSMFEECQNRILTMASIHESMYQSKDFIKIDISDYLNLLVKKIAASHKLQNNIDLKLSIPNVKFKSETIVPLGLIINEIMTNSFKYAFNEQNTGTVVLELKEMGKREFEMIIGDNGIGMSKNEENNLHSLGQELIEIFTEQLNGTMERLKEPGTMFKMKFKEA
ncbi:MAG: hypothetical protein COB15_02805 [Flavobacteriales bacterium]|nr:MAG: hypothetical protein COB15_02805 [Flavobacteriales bacterium]